MIGSVFDSDRKSTAVGADGTLHPSELGVAVYGLNRGGIALSVLCARVVPSVTAADTNGTRVAAIQNGTAPVSDSLLSKYVTESTNDGSLRATTELPTAAAESTIHLVTVSTGVRADDVPDLSTLRATLRQISTELSPGDVLILATPVPPGTTDGVVAATIADESGLNADAFGCAVCVLPIDRSLQSIYTGELVVAGSDTRSQTAATELFSAVTNGTVSTTPSVTTAECIGTVERTATEMLRCLSNELAVSAPAVDVPTVAEFVSMRTDIEVPSPGVDGQEPIGAGFLRDALVGQTPILDEVYDASRRFPKLIAETALAALDGPSPDEPDPTVLILGVPSENCRAAVETMPVSILIRELTRAETRPLVCDPVADLPRSLTPHAVSIRSANQLDPDVVVVLSFRLVFEEIDWSSYDETVVIDCCGSDFDGVDTDVRRLGATEQLQNK